MTLIPDPSHDRRTYTFGEHGKSAYTDGPYADYLDVDVLVIGAGFSGIYMLYMLRGKGYKTVLYDAGNDFGDMPHSDHYSAGITIPAYEFSIPELYNTWSWKTNNPEYEELREYFRHVGRILNLSQYAAFRTVVTSAEFDTGKAKWNVATADGRHAEARFLIPTVASFSTRSIPNFKNLYSFRGRIHHPSFWPSWAVETTGKRIAIVGTGASGVQMVHELGPRAKAVTLFHLMPDPAPPSKKKQGWAFLYPPPKTFKERCYRGFSLDWDGPSPWDNMIEERERFWEYLWRKGGLMFWLASYDDSLSDLEANRKVYQAWKRKKAVRAKDEDQYSFRPEEGSRITSLGYQCSSAQTYPDALNADTVEIIDATEDSGNEIIEFTENGLRIEGREFEFDIIALAPGFDSENGGLTSINLQSITGTTIQEEWINGDQTYLGTTINGYPNMFYIPDPYNQRILCNNPTAVEIQGRWVCDVIDKIESEHIKYINPDQGAQRAWDARMNELSDRISFSSLQGFVSRWLVAYSHTLREALKTFKGFTVVRE